MPDELVAQSFDLKKTADFEIAKARESVKKSNWKEHIRSYAYRPFDNRRICYMSDLIDRDRRGVMCNFLQDNLGFVSIRQYVYDSVITYNYAFCTENIIDNRFFSSNRGYCSVFPLYLHPSKEKKGLIS